MPFLKIQLCIGKIIEGPKYATAWGLIANGKLSFGKCMWMEIFMSWHEELAQYICYGIILTVLQARFYLVPLWEG